MAEQLKTFRAWQLPGPGPFSKNLKLNDAVPYPSKVPVSQVLVEVVSAGLNPADYKFPEAGLVAKGMMAFPKIPGMDISGRVVQAAEGSPYKPGDRVLGRVDPFKAYGGLGQFAVVPEVGMAKIADGVSFDDAAGVGTAGLTGYQPIAPNVKKDSGAKIFVNGGAGGTGTFAIQVGKALGCHVTTTCSTPKVEVLRGLGADEVVDYKTTDVAKALAEKGQTFDLVVDMVGAQDLYAASDGFLKTTGKYVMVGGSPKLGNMVGMARLMLLPGFLGGGKRKFEFYMTKNNKEDLATLAGWLAEGKVKTVIHKTYEFEEADQAYEELRKGSSTGKIIVHVGKQ